MQRKTLFILFLFYLYTFVFVNCAFSASPATKFLCEKGINYFRLRQYNEAMHEFNKVLILEPNNQAAKKYINKIFKQQIIKMRKDKRRPPRKKQ